MRAPPVWAGGATGSGGGEEKDGMTASGVGVRRWGVGGGGDDISELVVSGERRCLLTLLPEPEACDS